MSPNPYGRALHDILYNGRMWALLEPLGCGWLDGGCLPLAQALSVWLGSGAKLWAVRDGFGRAQHVVVRLGDLYLDGDGASSAQALRRRWKRWEGIAEPHLTPFDPVEAEAAGIFVSPELAAAALAALRAWRDGSTFAAALTDTSATQG